MTHIDCATCGEYVITGSLLSRSLPLPDNERYRFSFWNKRRKLEGRPPTPLSGSTIDAILAQLPTPATHEKPDILLVSLTLAHPQPGQWFKLDGYRERSLACAKDDSELEYFTQCLIDSGHIQRGPPGLMLREGGWERAYRLAANTSTSKYAFVAMAFNEEMLSFWKTAFKPAIERAGFIPRLANDPVHNEQIDARIIAELKQCRFVVADVTGARTGVYFEAGYALGRALPVIWTCRRSTQQDMHFDTRQYNHILWDNSAHLSEELYYRIVATI